MNRKTMIVGYAGKKGAAVLRVLLIMALLFGSPGALLMAQAENEMTLPAEAVVQQPDAASTESAPSETEIAQAQTEGTAEAAQPESTAQESTGETAAAQEEAPLDTTSITMIGDSIMVGASASLWQLLPGCVIDAKVGRQFSQADDVLTSLESQNAVGQVVVIGLGTNGPFSVEKGQALIDRLGSGRTIYWVTVYGRELSWQEDSNAVIRALAENNENVHLIEWAQAVSGHPEWIRSDGIHLSVPGKAGYAGFVAGELLK
ncbi:MAG: hypothetical protein NC302_06765 [Bacteroidales bacterium]|nr:hypothetical protein [Bacteroidales bacterium]MCM1415401.1 hypothetical protein [bacterium]MCM1423334.1 hypothetical protein [bacterium]